MIIEALWGALAILALVLSFIALKVNKKHLNDLNYYEVTLLLGSGGHTGEMCELLRGFHFNKAQKINVLIGNTDRSS